MIGLEGIFGAFVAGLILNRFIPKVSPLMNRLEFTGNALFIPYFLIGVGMLIDLHLLFEGGRILWVVACIAFFGTPARPWQPISRDGSCVSIAQARPPDVWPHLRPCCRSPSPW